MAYPENKVTGPKISSLPMVAITEKRLGRFPWSQALLMHDWTKLRGRGCFVGKVAEAVSAIISVGLILLVVY